MVIARPKVHVNKPERFDKKSLTTFVKLSEVVGNGLRLEATCYAIQARKAVSIMETCGHELISIYGPGGMAVNAHNAFRMKRIYVKKEYGVPFLTSSDIISISFYPEKFISKLKTKKIEKFIVNKHEILISRSGTIGNISIAGEKIAGSAVSEDVIRIKCNNSNYAGFLAAFLRSKYGRSQIKGIIYGSVIKHIEPTHLKWILIPNFPPILINQIGSRFIEATKLRDQANELIDQAIALIPIRLGLPEFGSLKRGMKGARKSLVRATKLVGRFDGSFHDPIALKASELIDSLLIPVVKTEDQSVAKELWAVTRFRKRIFVRYGGILMLNSKQLFQVDPIDVKRIAKGAHTKNLSEIGLKKNMIAVTCSGTVGKVQIIPGYMAGWTASQDALRLISSDYMNPGYLYAWLASEYGQCLLKRNSYGSVIIHLDREMLAETPFPIPHKSIMDEIGDLVLKANELRDQAWNLEKQAIQKLENLIEGNNNLEYKT